MATYHPPYESPIEDDFALNFVKYIKDNIVLNKQVEIDTICGKFRVDFSIESPTQQIIAFECDGKEFHEESRDEWRDAMILGSSDINEIYRLRGSDLTYHMNDILYIISKYIPHIFSERGLINLGHLASKEALSHSLNAYSTIIRVAYISDPPQSVHHIIIERRHKNIPKGKRQFWQASYKFALEHGGGQLDNIISNYRSRK